MQKRLILLLVFAIVLTAAPSAMASHCARCLPSLQTCASTLNFGYEVCYWHPPIQACILEYPCGPHLQATPEPLSAEFTVASVERLDESNANAPDTRVASLETSEHTVR